MRMVSFEELCNELSKDPEDSIYVYKFSNGEILLSELRAIALNHDMDLSPDEYSRIMTPYNIGRARKRAWEIFRSYHKEIFNEYE